MSEKAEATAKRIEQSMSDLERQISWVTRASSYTLEQRRADYAQLLNQVPARQPADPAQRRRAASSCGCHAPDGHLRQQRRFLPRPALHRDGRPRRQLRAVPYFRDGRPFMSIAVAHSGFKPASPSPKSTCASSATSSASPGRQGRLRLYRRPASGQVLASSAKGPEIGKDLSALPQVAAVLTPAALLRDGHRRRRPCGADRRRARCRSSAGSCSSSSRPRRRWRRSATSWCGSRC